jgi:hypothetical protein
MGGSMKIARWREKKHRPILPGLDCTTHKSGATMQRLFVTILLSFTLGQGQLASAETIRFSSTHRSLVH